MWLVEREKGERGKQALCMQANFSVSTEKQSEFKGGKPDCCGPRAESGFLTLQIPYSEVHKGVSISKILAKLLNPGHK